MGLQHWKRRELPQERAEKRATEKRAFDAQIQIGLARQKPGPKPSGNAKQLLSLRLDQDVIAKFRATGPGWQARMNDVLKAAKV